MNKISILGYKSDLLEPWDDSTPLTRSLPGSEEAVIYLSRELVRLGYRVKVWMDPPEDSPHSLETSNPRYLPVDEFQNYYHGDEIVVCWRTSLPPETFTSRLRLYWPHDTFGRKIPSEIIKSFNGVLWLSPWQYHNYVSSQGLWGKTSKIFLGNGWTPFSEYPLLERSPHSCIYGSNWSRGLEVVLDSWPEVRQKYPDATLTIAYGPNTWTVWSKEKEAQVLQRVESMKNLGVTNVGSIDHVYLERLYNEHSLWLYPNIDRETFCITAVKAQGAGCIPVVVRKEGLNETVAPFADTASNNKEWRELLFKTLERASSISLEERQRYIDFSKNWLWSETAKRFDTFVKGLLS